MQDNNDSNHLGVLVKSARRAKGKTQIQLAASLSISARYLKAIENSGRKPSYKLLVRIVQELDIPTDAVFYTAADKKGKSTKLVPLWKISREKEY